MTIKKLWGEELIVVNNALYCGKMLKVLPNGYRSSIHYHVRKHETFFIFEGCLFLEIFKRESIILDEFVLLNKGQKREITPLTPHRFWSRHVPALVIEFSTHDLPNDSIRLEPSGVI